ncbi:MAG: hypothetical protein M9938_11360 [Solirubrobacterales bacterium]|nr:hypothetical protein [Solirubrobacterales bacterium]
MELTRDRRVTLAGPPALIWPASLFLAVTGVVTIIRAATPFEDGIWLIAFLLLVGFLAQVLLAVGQAALRPEGISGSRVAAEALLWNVGTVLVPVGTMTGGKLGVILGSIALIAALALFARSGIEAGAGGGLLRPIYLLFAVFMAVSVATGIGLSWTQPWL